jgi:hypothetical protein
VFIDETGTSTKMARRCGRSRRGERCRAPVPHGHAKLKAFLKKHAPRTVDDLWGTIARGIDTFSPVECLNYFAAAGYDRE